MGDNGATHEGDAFDDLKRAIALALDLQRTVRRIQAPLLHRLVNLILIELGRRLSNETA